MTPAEILLAFAAASIVLAIVGLIVLVRLPI